MKGCRLLHYSIHHLKMERVCQQLQTSQDIAVPSELTRWTRRALGFSHISAKTSKWSASHWRSHVTKLASSCLQGGILFPFSIPGSGQTILAECCVIRCVIGQKCAGIFYVELHFDRNVHICPLPLSRFGSASDINTFEELLSDIEKLHTFVWFFTHTYIDW